MNNGGDLDRDGRGAESANFSVTVFLIIITFRTPFELFFRTIFFNLLGDWLTICDIR